MVKVVSRGLFKARPVVVTVRGWARPDGGSISTVGGNLFLVSFFLSFYLHKVYFLAMLQSIF